MEIFFIVFLKIIMENYIVFFFNIPNKHETKKKSIKYFYFRKSFFCVRFYAL